MNIKSIKNYKIKPGERFLVRCDLDVPCKGGKVLDDFRLVKLLDTVKFLSKNKAIVILMGHLGRPEKPDLKFSLENVAKHLAKLLKQRIEFYPEIFSKETETGIANLKNGDIAILENLRFNRGEKKNSFTFAKKIAKYADVYVNNAFANSHRQHASMSAIKNYLPAFAGLMVEQEIINLNKIISPKKPLVLLMGGAKVATKMPIIKNLGKVADYILVGGGLANNFLAARGFEIGKSLSDAKDIQIAKKLFKKNIILPSDVVVRDLSGAVQNKKSSEVAKSDKIYDIGPETVKLFSYFIRKAQTIAWNGPLGMFESSSFKHGTLAIGQLIANRSKGKIFGLIGGGETHEAMMQAGHTDYLDWVSTGGGAMLAFLGGEKMPGLKGIYKK